jgi:capsule biosynthesis phosphatase
MIYVFDIDNTICETINGDYKNSKPIKERIDSINELYETGHTIIFNTARGMGRTKGDILMVYEMFFDFTKDQLDNWGVKYNKIYMGKPAGDIYVDDKGIRDDRFFEI